MRQPEKCSMEYHGFKSPRAEEELDFEILGLKNLIKKAKERISLLEQSKFLVEKAVSSGAETLKEYFEKEKV